MDGDFLATPAGVVSLGEGSPDETPGSNVGPYTVLELIGEGGFGLVFLAEQHHPVRRKVAVKVLKPGMDSRQIIARFEAERQALAMMDHPNIAKMLDAGETASGRPYFAMELVRGVPITKYCDSRNRWIACPIGTDGDRLPGRATRASERNHSPRPQAEQCPGERGPAATARRS